MQLHDGADETISSSTVICAKVYNGTTLKITGNNINVTTDGGYASLHGGRSYLLLEKLNSSSVSNIAVTETGGRSDWPPFPLFSKAIHVLDSSNNRLTNLWAQCFSGASRCNGMVLDNYPSGGTIIAKNENNQIENYINVNGIYGILVLMGNRNVFKGALIKTFEPECWFDRPKTNTFLTTCSH